jgi:hypothetical protein
MKKYIYSAALVAVITACVVFFYRPAEINPPADSKVLAITFQLPENYEFTEQAPFVLTWRTESVGGALAVPVTDGNFNPVVSPYKLVFTSPAGTTAVILNARLYYCHKTSRMCFQDDFQARVPLTPGAVSPIPWVWEIEPKKA